MELVITKPSKIEGDDDLVHYLRTLQNPLASLIRAIEGSEGIEGSLWSSSSASRKRSREQDKNETSKKPTSPVCNYLAIDDSGRALILAAHRELLRHEASLSTNKRSAPAIELLLRSSSAAQITRFGASLLPYLRFLSTNRHASHVLQTFLSLARLVLSGQRSISEAECSQEVWDLPLSSSSGSTVALMLREFEIPPVGSTPAVEISLSSPVEVLKSLASLIKVWTLVISSSSDTLPDILYDSGGTHVLRALIGVLTGVNTESLSISVLPDEVDGGVLVGESEADPSSAIDRVLFKGRGRSKKAMKKTEDGFENGVKRHSEKPSSGSSNHRTEFKEVFIRLTLSVLSLSNSNAEELGALGCDVNASATLQLLIEASSLIAPNLCKVLCRSVSNWGLEGLSKEEISGEADLYVSSEVVGEEDATSKRKSKSRKQSKSTDNLDAATDIGDVSNHWLYRLCTHSIGSRLVECLFTFADPPLFHAFVESFFKPHMKELCANPYGNFSIQKLLISVPESRRSRYITDTLLMEASSCVGMLYDQRKSGVLLHIAAAAAGAPPVLMSSPSTGKQEEVSKHNSQISYRNQNAPAASDSVQGAIITAFLTVSAERRSSYSSSSGTHSSGEVKNDAILVRLILNLPEQTQTKKSSLGSSAHFALPKGPVTSAVFPLTLAHLLRFSSIHSRVILDSFLSLTPYEIASLATDPTASRHVLEPLFELQESSVSSTSVISSDHFWAKNKLHTLLKGFYASLAVTRCGSWVVSKAFINLDIKRKASIAAELVEEESRLRSGGSAQISALLKMMRIEQFKTSRIGWEAYWVKDKVKKREILESVQADADHMVGTSLINKVIDNNDKKVVNDRAQLGSTERGKIEGEKQLKLKRGVSTEIQLKALGF